MGNFRELVVWRVAKELAIQVYRIKENNPRLALDFSFYNQIRRSAVSIPSNIAEGNAMPSGKHSLHFFYLAKGSLAELQTQLEITLETGQLSSADFERLQASANHVGVLLSKLIHAVSAPK